MHLHHLVFVMVTQHQQNLLPNFIHSYLRSTSFDLQKVKTVMFLVAPFGAEIYHNQTTTATNLARKSTCTQHTTQARTGRPIVLHVLV